MKSAYEGVTDYQATLEVENFTGEGGSDRKRLLYTFKKPNRIRLDFESPRAGTTLVYPHGSGKALVRPGGLLRFLKIPLAPTSRMLQVSPGQRIDQTDLGLLIENIARSLTVGRRGDVRLSSDPPQTTITVVADNHFRPGVVSRYTFRIDDTLWLPVEVEERDLDGNLERQVIFGDLRVNVGFADEFFRLD